MKKYMKASTASDMCIPASIIIPCINIDESKAFFRNKVETTIEGMTASKRNEVMRIILM